MADYFTPNFRIRIPPFNERSWHDDYKNGFVTLDAFLAKYIVSNNIKGVWQTDTAYVVGDVVVDADLGNLWICAVSHTSGVDTFAAERLAQPTWWSAFTQSAKYAGVWQPNTPYAIGDFSINGQTYIVANTTHVSNATFDAEEEAQWDVLIDLTGVTVAVPPPTAGVALNYIRINAAGSAYEVRTPSQALVDINALSVTDAAATYVAKAGSVMTGALGIGAAVPGTPAGIKLYAFASSGNSVVLAETTDAAAVALMRFKSPGASYDWRANPGSPGNFMLYDATAGQGRLTIDGVGNIGIGALPQSGTTKLYISNPTDHTSVRIEAGGTAKWAQLFLKNSVREYGFNTDNAGTFILFDNTAGAPRLSIDTSGVLHLKAGSTILYDL